MFASELSTMTNSDLVGVYNNLNPDKPLNGYKGKKDALIARIEKLRTSEPESVSVVKPVDATPKPVEVPVEDETDQKTTGNEPERTIRAAAIEHLCHVAFYEDRGKKSSPENVVDEGDKGARTVGIAYDEIIDRIKQEFPDCDTSVACLRWYSVKIRVEEHGYEGLSLPQRRPRAKPKKA